MKKTNEQSLEIVSFNQPVYELPSLLELSEMELEQVAGGVGYDPDAGGGCGTLTCGEVVCGTLGCGTFHIIEL